MAKKVTKQVKEVETMTMVERYASLKGQMHSINEAYKAGKDKDAESLMEDMTQAMATYNKLLRHEEYAKWQESGNIVKAALVQGDIEQLTIKKGKLEKSDITCLEFTKTGEIPTKRVLVDLREIDAFTGGHGGCFESGQWYIHIDDLRVDLNERLAKDYENKSAQKYVCENMRAAAGKGAEVADRTSNTQLKKSSQQIADEILAGNTVTGKDIQFLLYNMTGLSSKSLATSKEVKTDTVIKLFTHMMHRILNKKQYGIEFSKSEK